LVRAYDLVPLGVKILHRVCLQAVLDRIEVAINADAKGTLAALSSEFYSLIPHNFGRQRPEAITALPKLFEKVPSARRPRLGAASFSCDTKAPM